MEHPLTRLKAVTGRRTGVLAMEAANTTNAASARQTWSYWLRGRRAPNAAQLGRLVRMATEAGAPGLGADILSWGTTLALELEEAPTVTLTPERLAEDAQADARFAEVVHDS